MTNRNLALKIGLCVAAAALALPAMAEEVSFTTTGTFACGTASVCGLSNGGSTITITNNGTTITDTAVGRSYTNLLTGGPAADVNVMEFDDTSTPGGTGALVNGSTFTLKITQSDPVVTPNSGTLSGDFSGTIFRKNTDAFIDFGANTTLVLGDITYTLDSSIWNMSNPGSGTTGIAIQTAQVTPEPTFMLLTGLGFGCLAFLAYRRKRTA
ncbi:MAG TPA: hypothetical protein VG297_25650 [Bryobacteraceae bacterium]|nr:hypothetical protein [Bryobacteraceae bacterium]